MPHSVGGKEIILYEIEVSSLCLPSYILRSWFLEQWTL